MRLSHELAFQPHKLFQFTHPGKGATWEKKDDDDVFVVSIHAPWEGCDSANAAALDRMRVSIHAPWEGCDSMMRRWTYASLSFNSRTLGRVRPTRSVRAMFAIEFQFTHPGKGATNGRRNGRLDGRVSIHAPWEGCD